MSGDGLEYPDEAGYPDGEGTLDEGLEDGFEEDVDDAADDEAEAEADEIGIFADEDEEDVEGV